MFVGCSDAKFHDATTSNRGAKLDADVEKLSADSKKIEPDVKKPDKAEQIVKDPEDLETFQIIEKTFENVSSLNLSTNHKADIILVVDNSSTMEHEVANVRANISTFFNSLNKNIDLRVALISRNAKDSIYGVDLPERSGGEHDMQIDIDVPSYSLLQIAAVASCPESSTDYGRYFTRDIVIPAPAIPENERQIKICHEPFTGSEIQHIMGLNMTSNSIPFDPFVLDESRYIVPNTFVSNVGTTMSSAGKLVDFMRPGVRKAFIFVSDEDEALMDAEGFMRAMDRVHGTGLTSVFAWVGSNVSALRPDKTIETAEAYIVGDRCELYLSGQKYQKLALQSHKGQFFDICKDDWSSDFEILREKIKNIASEASQFDLKLDNVVSIESLSILGQPVPKKHYRVIGSTLTINNKYLLSLEKQSFDIKVLVKVRQ